MIRLFRRTVVRTRDQHTVSRKDINPDALKVLYRLRHCGYKAYLVGGGVRDLLLGRKPKDFDISTDAHPNELKRLFRNCFLVGRRFRLAHIRFGTHIVETSTFRRQPEVGEDGELLQHRDNTFGTPEEDARRRDFTVNGLFYDIETFSVIDHVGGLEDLKKGIIRSIGDANDRFREDPVRMLRAIRFASRLGFKIERKTYRAIIKHRAEIVKASAPRLQEEIARLFAYRSGRGAFKLLRETGLLAVLFPELDEWMNGGRGREGRFWRMLGVYDEWAPESGALLSMSFAALFYLPFRDAVERARAAGEGVHYAEAAREVFRETGERYRCTKRDYYHFIRLLDTQRHFDAPPRRGSRPRFVRQESFHEALALYGLYCRAIDADMEVYNAWRNLVEREGVTRRATAETAETDDRVATDESATEKSDSDRKRRRRRGGRRRRRAPRGDNNAAASGD